VLFLDELPEFRRNAIEALRPTMESGRAVVVRARERVVMPAKPLVVAAMNPCPCGYAGDTKRICRCTFEQAQRYRSRVSGPMVDRFDLHVLLPAVPIVALQQAGTGEPSSVVRERVVEARAFALTRAPGLRSSELAVLRQGLEADAHTLLGACVDAFGLSMRAYAKVLKVARTIADLDGSDAIVKRHVAEAVQYRTLDGAPLEPPAALSC
jgi:magnesium chelatase family protein